MAPAEEVVNTKLSEQIALVLSDLTRARSRCSGNVSASARRATTPWKKWAKRWRPRERIRQIEAKALRKLRHPVRSQQLRSYYDS